MASIIPGYEYDIFISYRQKDNRHDGWVTEFVDNLKGELESTFKEEINVYFDINPHDGLLETHDVDASLKEKLKCLIFIPIISRTYCDPKSFAWEHEFKAFVKMASQDEFGLKVKLRNGNVGSRVLPVRIHDLDIADIKECEAVLGGVLRGVELIYREPGVDRPLTAKDNEEKNLNKTNYRNQINKVALAIREIYASINLSNHNPEKSKKGIDKSNQVQRKNYKKTIISGSLVAFSLIVLGLLFIPKIFNSTYQIEKSIAVLPFFNDSPDEENEHFINGIMDEILNNLQIIEDLRVVSRSSVEQYRDVTRPVIPEIGKHLDVNYIVEGSGQKYGNTVRLRVQLIEAATDKHLWAESYENEIRVTSDVFNLQVQIAESIVAELKAILTPYERQLINNTPTLNLRAYDYYQRGNHEYSKYAKTGNKTSLEQAEDLYYTALENDSTFGLVYIGLAHIYKARQNLGSYYSETYLDSVLILSDKALSFDENLYEAYILRGDYLISNGQIDEAMREYNKAIRINPNSWLAHYRIGSYSTDYLKRFESLFKAASLNQGPELPRIYKAIASLFRDTGFYEKCRYYLEEALKMDGDSASYFVSMGVLERTQSNYGEDVEYLLNAYAINPYPSILISLGTTCQFTGQFKESLQYFELWFDKLKDTSEISISNIIYNFQRVGYAYWQNGNKGKAQYYFNKHIESCKHEIELNRYRKHESISYFDIAGVYAFLGEKGKAYENLREFSQRNTIPAWQLQWFKDDPLFESIRHEPEFQKIQRKLETIWQSEHEQVREWLEEKNML